MNLEIVKILEYYLERERDKEGWITELSRPGFSIKT